MLTAMAASANISSQEFCRLPCFHSFILLLVSAIFCATVASGSETPVSYHSNCASVVPESTPTVLEFVTLSFPRRQTGYYKTLDPNSSPYTSSHFRVLFFRIINMYGTDVEGVFKVEASLILQSSIKNYSARNSSSSSHAHAYTRRSDPGSGSFKLQGFWSSTTWKLCMVGSRASYSRKGNLLDLPAVLKLNNVANSSTITSLITGTFESLSSVHNSRHFEPISLLMFPLMNYKYTTVSKESDAGCSGGANVPESLSLSLPLSKTICSMFLRSVNAFELQYASDCNSASSCNPLGDQNGYLPKAMSLSTLQCSDDRQSLRFLLGFHNSSYVGYYQPFSDSTTLIGEGSWDRKKNQLCAVVCRVLNATSSLEKSHVGDCTMRLSLRFPAFMSIRNSSSALGKIWSNKTVDDLGYFHPIAFRNTNANMFRVPGWKYVYTEMEKVKSVCLKKHRGNKGGRYPNGYSREMRFDISVRTSRGKVAWGSMDPLSVGDEVSQWLVDPAESAVAANTSSASPVNISYTISLTLTGVRFDGRTTFNLISNVNSCTQISAEGTYDAEMGNLCMIGCRRLGLNNQAFSNDSVDCEIHVNLHFPPLNADNGSYITGTVESTRKKSDPLYFEQLHLSSAAFYAGQQKKSVWRMDLEIIMALLSNTLTCYFVGFQLLHVKKHPGVLPFISLLMLAILTLGHLFPLVLNFEALFFQNRTLQTVLLGAGGWLEVNEVIVRVVTMVAFLLDFRLLQLTWFGKQADGNKSLWAAEKKALYVSVPLYLSGGLIALVVNSRKNKQKIMVNSSHLSGKHHFLWGNLKSYTGLVLDGFLLPQILLNIFQDSKENAVSSLFYLGTTFVHLLSHGYDLYRAHKYANGVNETYIYANPGADFYSAAWDVIILFGGLLFAVIVFFQQQFGGRCFLPSRFRDLGAYAKVPVVAGD